MATKQSIFDIQEDFRTFRDSILEKEGVIGDEQYETLKAMKLTAEEKLTQCYFVLCQWEAEASVAKDAIAVATSHKNRRENSIKALKSKMVSLAQEIGMTKLDTPHVRMAVCAGKTTLNIPDVEMLPGDLIESVVTESLKPKTEEIEKLLNAGKEVPGAAWKTGDAYLRFTKAKGE